MRRSYLPYLGLVLSLLVFLASASVVSAQPANAARVDNSLSPSASGSMGSIAGVPQKSPRCPKAKASSSDINFSSITNYTPAGNPEPKGSVARAAEAQVIVVSDCECCPRGCCGEFICCSTD
jgi:hypothetical protein